VIFIDSKKNHWCKFSGQGQVPVVLHIVISPCRSLPVRLTVTSKPQNMYSLDLRLTCIYRVHISLSVSSQFTLFDLHFDESPIVLIDRKVDEILWVFVYRPIS